jgi:hypothetical protein
VGGRDWVRRIDAKEKGSADIEKETLKDSVITGNREGGGGNRE